MLWGRLISMEQVEQGPTKRPLMGAAAQSADYVVVTDDNPLRDPKHIRNMVLEGTRGQDHVKAEPCRSNPEGGRYGLLITGKGRQGQIIDDDVLPTMNRQVLQ